MLRPRSVPRPFTVQQAFFRKGSTLPVEARLALLRELRLAIHAMERELLAALSEDLKKSGTEARFTELGPLYAEIRHMLRHLRGYARPKLVRPALTQLPGRCELRPVPKGNVLVIAPWNYPLLLALLPAIDAIAAGNTVILKPSEFAPATGAALHELCRRLPEEWISAISGGAETGRALLDLPFHHIFYTGGARVGRLVMKRAARQLIPVTLELGGKSPCLVMPDADIALAARRIVFGKFLNCGQTCVAPDYVYVHASVKDELLAEMEKALTSFYGETPLDSPHYGKIIHRAHFDRLMALLDNTRPFLGGNARPDKLQIAPTIVEATPESPLMEEEIFGPILPVLDFKTLDEALSAIRERPAPLAFYLFTRDRALQTRLMSELPFGGGCVNDTILHLASPRMGFGGTGESGIGSYHGKAGFDCFSHHKSILCRNGSFDPGLRYPPYDPCAERLLRLLMR